MKSLITGGTGFIGRKLAAILDDPIIVGRSVEKIRSLFPHLAAKEWDVHTKPDNDFFEDVDVIYHLAGESVAGKRWNSARKEGIYNSRVESTRLLVEAIARAERKPSTLVCASAVGFFGDRGDEELTENSPAGEGFLAEVCIDWEKAALEAQKLGVRVVCIRIPMVLGPDGGALAQMVPLFKLGVGGRLGNGKQYMPWVHVDDLVNILKFAAENSEISGALNAVAPEFINNKLFTKALAKSLHRRAIFPAPAFALKLILGEFASVLLASQKVAPVRLLQTDFEFKYPGLEAALDNLFSGGYQKDN